VLKTIRAAVFLNALRYDALLTSMTFKHDPPTAERDVAPSWSRVEPSSKILDWIAVSSATQSDNYTQIKQPLAHSLHLGNIIPRYLDQSSSKVQHSDPLRTTRLWPLYRSTCVSRHLQLRTGKFCWCKVLLPACPCWSIISIHLLYSPKDDSFLSWLLIKQPDVMH